MMHDTTDGTGATPATDPIPEALRELAAREEAPAELDLLVEPLRLAEPRPPLVRPALRWAAAAAAAAALALWLPVLLRSAAPPPLPAASGPEPDHEYFKLHPLPGNDGQEEAGAVAHLLREPPPDPAEAVGTPAPLEIMGPADEAPATAASGRSWSLDVAGRRVPVQIPEPAASGPRDVELRIVGGRVVSGTGPAGEPLPAPLLEALAAVKLEPELDGRFPARLSPPRSSAGSSSR